MDSSNREFESCIGKGTKVSGKVEFGAAARIEGEVDGELTGGEIVIAQGATVKARVVVDRMVVAGKLSGEVVARQRIELMATARVQGNLDTPKLVLHEGAQFDGDCKMPRDRIAA
ncbi:MAG: polymer-forming cytoskeletal protein [Candidatus Binataceae bacterium]|jgi:cytoskeletal protein CcmA (bactofilin family)